MTKVLKLSEKEQSSKITPENIKKQRLKINFIFLLVFVSCTTSSKKVIEWEYPPDNPYPSIMKSFYYKDKRPPCLIIELEPTSLQADCSMRNDSPYYWCGIDGFIKKPDPKLPKKIGTTYQSTLSKEGKKIFQDFAKRLKKANKPVFLVAPNGFYSKDGVLGNHMYGAYNEDECIDRSDDFSACPQTAKKFSISSGEYIK